MRGADGRWDMSMWATVSAVTWHARPRRLQHDLISIRQSHDQCAKHLAHRRFPRIMRDASGSDGDGKNVFSSHCMVSHRRHPWSTSASYSSLRRRRNVPKSKPRLQHQPSCSSTCCWPFCRKGQTSKCHLTSQLISLSSARSGMVSLLLSLLRLT